MPRPAGSSRASRNPAMVVAEPVASSVVSPWGPHVEGRLKVMIAGGGIGGLCTALVLQNQGHDVHIYEKATSYRPFGGPIQIASNALESLKRIDQDVYDAILEQSTSIGTRKNGLKDGLSNEWFATFDLFAPARRRGQDSSVVIDRPILQEILLQGIGRGTVSNGCEVTGYTKHQYSAPGNSVTGLLSNGSSVQCDLLIGSDGINSKVRARARARAKVRVKVRVRVRVRVRARDRLGRDQLEGTCSHPTPTPTPPLPVTLTLTRTRRCARSSCPGCRSRSGRGTRASRPSRSACPTISRTWATRSYAAASPSPQP